MEPYADAERGLKDGRGQVCQLCDRGVGTTVDGEIFVACHVCRFPVCRPCYEYERNAGSQCCPQCKTKYKRHKGSPPIRSEEPDDANADDVASDLNYPPGNQDQKQKVAEEIRQTHIPFLTHSRTVSSQLSGELSGASLDYHANIRNDSERGFSVYLEMWNGRRGLKDGDLSKREM